METAEGDGAETGERVGHILTDKERHEEEEGGKNNISKPPKKSNCTLSQTLSNHNYCNRKRSFADQTCKCMFFPSVH